MKFGQIDGEIVCVGSFGKESYICSKQTLITWGGYFLVVIKILLHLCVFLN